VNILSRNQRRILFLAASLNFLGSLPAIISPSFFFAQFFTVPPDLHLTFPYLAMYHYCFWGIGLIMGIAYWMTAVEPEKNKIVLLIGGLGKLLAVSFWLMTYLQGYGKWLMLTGVISDGIFGLLFLYWYFVKGINKEQ
jgi:hypothetical protein